MTNEEIRSACERAEALSTATTNDDLRAVAFAAILTHMLSGAKQQDLSASYRPPLKEGDKARREKGKKTAGLKARLYELHEQSFFLEPKGAAEVAAELKALGWTHNTTEISSRLADLTREKALRRSNSPTGRKGNYRYSNW